MKKLSFIAIILLLGICSAFAKTSTISGKVSKGEGLTVRLMTFADHVTYLRQTLAESTIQDDGRFSLTCDLRTTKYCWIDIEFQQAELFIQPGQQYEIVIELNEQNLSTSYYDRLGLDMEVVRDDTSRLNLYIQDFNQLYNDFLLSYMDNVKTRGSASSFEIFRKAVDLRFQKASHPYFLDYMRYKIASMQLFLRLKGKESIGFEYLTGQPVLFENIEYMDFFHLYFEKYFLTGSKYFNFNKTFDLIDGNATVKVILDSLKADPVLSDAGVRELLLLSGLKELYGTSGFKRNRILFLVQELAGHSSSSEIRRIAENLQLRFKRLQPGTPAPDFILPVITDNSEYRLSDFKGKFIYMAFFESGIPACQAELEMSNELYKTYRNKIHFVAISVDKDLEKLRQYVHSRDLPWLVLHYKGNLDFLEKYDAITFPHFILIDANGNVFSCPAASPSENIGRLFDSI